MTCAIWVVASRIELLRTLPGRLPTQGIPPTVGPPRTHAVGDRSAQTRRALLPDLGDVVAGIGDDQGTT
jgi:hypothetical protein